MHAALIEVDVRGVEREQGLRALREQIVPAVKSMPGFRGGVWLPGDDEGRGFSLTVWDTEADARAMADRFGPGSSPGATATVARCQVREVVAVEGIEGTPPAPAE